MSSEQIVLWLDEPKYDALQHILRERGTDLEAVMQARLEAYYRETVPIEEQTRINQVQEADRLAEAEAREANRRFTVYRVREGGQTTCFESELCLDEARSAARLRTYLREKTTGGAGLYADRPQQVRAIDGELFDRRAAGYQAGDEKIHGVLDIDMDAGTFAFLDREQGWRSYAIKDTSAAAYHAFRRQGRSDRRALLVFREKLQGRELPPATRRLTEQDVSFSDGIEEVCGKLNFYMDVVFDPDEVFGTHVAATDNGDWLNVYANYDITGRQVCGELDVILHRDNGQDQALSYKLDETERAILLAKMDAYCVEREGMTLEQFCAPTLDGLAPDPAQGMRPLQ